MTCRQSAIRVKATRVANFLAWAAASVAPVHEGVSCAGAECARRFEIGRAIGQYELHALKIGERVAERRPLRSVGQRFVQRAAEHTATHGADRNARKIDTAECRAKRLPGCLQDGVSRHRAMVELEAAGAERVAAQQFVAEATRHAGMGAVDDEAADLARATAVGGLGAHRQPIGQRSIADPGFLSTDAPVGAVGFGTGRNGRGVAAGMGVAPWRHRCGRAGRQYTAPSAIAGP